MRRPLVTLTILMLLVAAAGCRSGRREDPILRLSADESLDAGRQLMEDGKYLKARRYFTHAFEVEPNSRTGREALLLSADTLYLAGGDDNWIKCEAKYRDFLNRFPTSERSDYAQFQVANCLRQRMDKPDRDQKVTEQALQAYQELLRLYPSSSYADEAKEQIRAVRDNLAAHELVVGSFYIRYGICTAAIRRLEGLRKEYPDFEEMDHALFALARAYAMCRLGDDASAALDELHRRYPESEYVGKAEDKIDLDKLRGDSAGGEASTGSGAGA